MPHRTDVIYGYDGSFDGLMCCVYESFARKEFPREITAGDEQATLFERREIATDGERSHRVLKAVGDKICGDAVRLIWHAYLTCLPGRELYILKFLYLGFRNGRAVMRMLTDDTVLTLEKAVRHLESEAGLLRGFVRFSEFNGGLAATIEPKNNVLPLLKAHFISRYPDGVFLIYDRTNSLALVCDRGRGQILRVDGYSQPQSDAREAYYRALWCRFYDTIAVEGRENPKCRMTHMPKRYWGNMTEFQREPASLPPGEKLAALPL